MSCFGKTVSCIVPAWNEEGRVGKVLKQVIEYPSFDEIVVVDDGSTDRTYQEILKYNDPRLKVIQHKRNLGKAAALLTGFKNSTGDIIVMLDADLVGIDNSNFDDLLSYHEDRECMTMAVMSNMFVFQRVTGLSAWSGTRAVPKRIFQRLQKMEGERYAIESYINEIALNEKIPIITIAWENVDHIFKYDKIGKVGGHFADIKMSLGIFKKFGFFKSLLQIARMLIITNFSSKLIQK